MRSDAAPHPSEFLSKDELQQLTNRAWLAQQVEWFVVQGIPHRVDGKRLILSRFHVRQWLEGKTQVISSGPNWAAINN